MLTFVTLCFTNGGGGGWSAEELIDFNPFLAEEELPLSLVRHQISSRFYLAFLWYFLKYFPWYFLW